MKQTNNNELSPSEQAAANRSQVTPNSGLKKKKDTLLFAGLVLVCLVVGIVMMLPDKKTKRIEQEGSSDNASNTTLVQNLALIAKMKEDAKVLQETVNTRQQSRSNHPPILRNTKAQGLSQETLARMNASSSFTIGASSIPTEGVTNPDGTHATLTGNNPNAAFVNQQDDIIAVSAKRIPHPNETVPAGELIPATLEVAINSELPGMVRAISTRDIYALSGSKRLIPSGSTFVGQFNSGIVQGQSRLLLVWNRVQMSDGVIVTLNSPGTDVLGRAGQGADRVDRHFMERFGSGALLSILGGVTATSGVGSQDEYNSKSQYRMGIASSLQNSAKQTLEQDMQIKPTLSIDQGARINIFVAHDLDFHAVGAAYGGHTSQTGQSILSQRTAGGAPWKR